MKVDVVPPLSVKQALQNLHTAECFFLLVVWQTISLWSVKPNLMTDEFADISRPPSLILTVLQRLQRGEGGGGGRGRVTGQAPPSVSQNVCDWYVLEGGV